MKFKKYLIESNNHQNFFDILKENFPVMEKTFPFIEGVINKSNCQKIEFVDFNIPALGLALHDGVYLSNLLLTSKSIRSSDFSKLVFVLFHELAHEYQYKKYGAEKMYQIFTKRITVEEGAKHLKYCEDVADEFATRKMREFMNKFKQYDFIMTPKGYFDAPITFFIQHLRKMINMVEEKGYTDIIGVGEIFYNTTITSKL